MYSIVEQHRNKIHVVCYDKMGKRSREEVDFEPFIGLETNDGSYGWKSVDGKFLKPKKFPNVKEFKDFVFANQFNMDIYGNMSLSKWPTAIYQYIARRYANLHYNLDFMKVFGLDIEVHCTDGFPEPEYALWPISSMTVKGRVRF